MSILKYPSSGQKSTLKRWFVRVGESVTAGALLAEFARPGAEIVLESPEDGVVSETLVEAGRPVNPGDELVRLGGESDASADTSATLAIPKENAKSEESEMSGNVTPVLLPKVGNSMEEGTILAWHVAEGDVVEQGQILYDVETDKAAVEVEADQAGRLAKIVALDGDIVEVQQPVAYLAENDADLETYLKTHTEPSTAPEQGEGSEAPQKQKTTQAQPHSPAVISPGATRQRVSPAARKLAEQRGIDLTALPAGTGPDGRLISTDLPAQGAASAQDAEGTSRVALTPMRKAIGTALLKSTQTIPHFYAEITIDAAPMMAYYRACKADFKCSVNDVIVHACGAAIDEFPSFRSQLAGNDMITFPSANIGIAIGTDDGLLVPVVLGVDAMDLQQTATATRDAIGQARQGKLVNMGKGVFTISNLGMFGTERFSAIINPPEAAILAVGAVRDEAVVRDGNLVAGQVCTLTLSCDHRIIDGVQAAQFLARLKELLETLA